MGNKAASKGDNIKGDATVIHKWQVGTTPTSAPCSFDATISGAVSANVFINNRAAATLNSTASQSAAESGVPTNAQPAPSTTGKITAASKSVFINTKGAARHDDAAECCGAGKVVVSTATVFIGG